MTSCSTHRTNHDQPSMNPKPSCQCDTFVRSQSGIQSLESFQNSQPGMDSTLCVVLVGNRITKVHQQTIPQELGDMPIVGMDDFRTRRLIGTDHVPVLFGVELGGEF